MIEIRHLRSLLAIHAAKTLSEAAEHLHITQSALSHQIRALENHYGLPLFIRTRQGLKFTQGGQRLLTLAQHIVPHIQAAERDLCHLTENTQGELRIALECHTCFDWLMPVMDEFRQRWPEVEVDLVAGFHANPLNLLEEERANVVIGSCNNVPKIYTTLPLFRFEILLTINNDHRLYAKRYIEPQDLAGETLITYPVPEDRIDIIREVLKPAAITLNRRTAELTVAILQLVASRRGVAALPNWGIKNYVDYDYVLGKRIGKTGLFSELYGITHPSIAEKAYFLDFLQILRTVCAAQLDGIEML